MESSHNANFFCKTCGQQSDTIDELKQHEQTHEGGAATPALHQHPVELKPNPPGTSKNNFIVTFVLTILTVVTVVQTVYSYRVLGQLKGGVGTVNAAPLPSSLQNLPNMVGGC